LSQNLPQNMLKILKDLQKVPKSNNSQPEELMNLMKGVPQPPHSKQISNIILSSNLPDNKEENEKNCIKFEENAVNEKCDKSEKSEKNEKNMNDFLLLSKVATMCNQLNNEEKMQRKEITEKDEEEEKECDDMKFKSKKM